MKNVENALAGIDNDNLYDAGIQSDTLRRLFQIYPRDSSLFYTPTKRRIRPRMAPYVVSQTLTCHLLYVSLKLVSLFNYRLKRSAQ